MARAVGYWPGLAGLVLGLGLASVAAPLPPRTGPAVEPPSAWLPGHWRLVRMRLDTRAVAPLPDSLARLVAASRRTIGGTNKALADGSLRITAYLQPGGTYHYRLVRNGKPIWVENGHYRVGPTPDFALTATATDHPTATLDGYRILRLTVDSLRFETTVWADSLGVREVIDYVRLPPENAPRKRAGRVKP